jgi:ketosteroid isomerase-like protein
MLSEADQFSIRAVHDAWLEAEQRGDVEAVLNLCSEDVEWVPPDAPSTRGRGAGRGLLLAPAIRLLSIEIADLTIHGAEGRAVKACRYETVFESTETHLRGVVRGNHTWRLTKEVDGWRVTSVSWQLDAEGEVPSSASSVRGVLGQRSARSPLNKAAK